MKSSRLYFQGLILTWTLIVQHAQCAIVFQGDISAETYSRKGDVTDRTPVHFQGRLIGKKWLIRVFEPGSRAWYVDYGYDGDSLYSVYIVPGATSPKDFDDDSVLTNSVPTFGLGVQYPATITPLAIPMASPNLNVIALPITFSESFAHHATNLPAFWREPDRNPMAYCYQAEIEYSGHDSRTPKRIVYRVSPTRIKEAKQLKLPVRDRGSAPVIFTVMPSPNRIIAEYNANTFTNIGGAEFPTSYAISLHSSDFETFDPKFDAVRIRYSAVCSYGFEESNGNEYPIIPSSLSVQDYRIADHWHNVSSVSYTVTNSWILNRGDPMLVALLVEARSRSGRAAPERTFLIIGMIAIVMMIPIVIYFRRYFARITGRMRKTK